ncbi:hypothetical protein HPP92_008507 [Vanilla planifolia]|uniref:BHLH domain-containing protein n=1 Tax=Vanilla planifolia TaxID=51239 RepID=A0A835RDG1_VANPL|nr:hypothetical protein HPP92_008507 [Vanilla planifolia]
MQSQEEAQVKHFRKQLAACVRTIRWSYAIFWSMSAGREGYVKNRSLYVPFFYALLLEWNDGYYNGDIKTRKTTQITACDRNLQNKRPASLSPEDLTDAEWYYLVCMSFTFNLGQDLPGKVYECNEFIWLCNAQLAENQIFCRSLLAKSASIQTVVCLPFMNGVLEFGTSDLLNVPNKGTKRMTGLLEGQMGHLMDDEFSNVFHEHFSCGFLTSPRGERVKRNMLDVTQVDNHAHLCSLDADGDGLHYASTISAVLASSKEQTSFLGFHFKNCSNESSFSIWKEGPKASKIHSKTPQRMLKKILIDGKWMNDRQMKYQEEKEENVARNKSFKSEADDTNANHVLSERRRREKLNEKFVILRSLVPSISKVDKASILADTIEYLKELERRVEELESCKGDTDLGMTKRSSYPDIAERTSDNYGNNRLDCQVTSTKKRKACDNNEAEGEHPLLSTKGGAVDINVTTMEKEVLVEMQCPWRNFLLLDLVEAMSNIQLDVHLVQTSTIDGCLAITMRAKFVNTVIVSPWMIKRALQRVVTK